MILTLGLGLRPAVLALCMLAGGSCTGAPLAAPELPAATQAAPPGSPRAASAFTDVVINEILAHTDPPLQDSIELYNPLTVTVSLDGWFFNDQNNPDPNDPTKWYRIPAGTTLAAGGYLVFAMDDSWPFRLSEYGEILNLYRPSAGGRPGAPVDRVTFGVNPNGISMGNYVTSDGARHFPFQSERTLGAPNAGPLVGPLVISEIMYHPLDKHSEYIVVTNDGEVPAPLYDPQHPANTWRLGGWDSTDFVFPAGLVLGAHRSIVAAAVDPAEFRRQYDVPSDTLVVGPFTGKLNNAGERVALLAPQPPEVAPVAECIGIVCYAALDVVNYLPTTPWPAAADGGGLGLIRRQLGAFADDPANWTAGESRVVSVRQAFLPLVVSR